MGNVRDDEECAVKEEVPTIKFVGITIQVPKQIEVAQVQLSSWEVGRAITEWVRGRYPDILKGDAVKIKAGENVSSVVVEVTRDG